MGNIYLKRYAYPIKYIAEHHYDNPKMVIVLPCHNEPDLISALEALERAACSDILITVVVVINASVAADDQIKITNEKTLHQCQDWFKSSLKNLSYHFILENELPVKHAGVGLARKIGMDEAIRIFDYNDHDGIILCYDADSDCADNLLIEVYQHFKQNTEMVGCSIHYEHPLTGDLDLNIYTGIINYELHLRYYVDALRFTGFPYAYQTIGSSMAVRSSVYQKQGGMNRRKAGEDFYFLHKIIPLGGYENINSTTVFPSPRRSDRVPFGTGRAIGDWLDEGKKVMLTYHPQAFLDLKLSFQYVDSLYDSDDDETISLWNQMPVSFQGFVSQSEFEKQMAQFKSNSSSPTMFVKRFYQWFDGFKVLKFVHYFRDQVKENVSIGEAVDWLFDELKIIRSGDRDLKSKLITLRKWDRENT